MKIDESWFNLASPEPHRRPWNEPPPLSWPKVTLTDLCCSKGFDFLFGASQWISFITAPPRLPARGSSSHIEDRPFTRKNHLRSLSSAAAALDLNVFKVDTCPLLYFSCHIPVHLAAHLHLGGRPPVCHVLLGAVAFRSVPCAAVLYAMLSWQPLKEPSFVYVLRFILALSAGGAQSRGAQQTTGTRSHGPDTDIKGTAGIGPFAECRESDFVTLL